MEYLDLLDVFEEIVQNAKKSLVSNKCSIDRDEALDIVHELREKLPEEIKRARKIVEERKNILERAQDDARQIIAEAKEDANVALQEAESKAQELVDGHRITQMATEQARTTVDDAQQKVREMRLGARDYADRMLQDLEGLLQTQIREVQKNRASLK